MNDDRQNRENEIFKEERDKAQARQDERDFLKDKSIGGKDAPRPTEDFIERSLGKDQSSMELTREASERTDKRMLGEDAKAKNREAHDRADRARTQGSEKIQPEHREKPSERMKRKKEEKRDRGRGR